MGILKNEGHDPDGFMNSGVPVRTPIHPEKERTFQTYKGWRSALRRECPSVEFEGDRDICQAFGRWLGRRVGIGQWDGETGLIEYPADKTLTIDQLADAANEHGGSTAMNTPKVSSRTGARVPVVRSEADVDREARKGTPAPHSRWVELSKQCLEGTITPRDYRSCMVAQLSIMGDSDTRIMCGILCAWGAVK